MPEHSGASSSAAWISPPTSASCTVESAVENAVAIAESDVVISVRAPGMPVRPETASAVSWISEDWVSSVSESGYLSSCRSRL